MAVRPSGRLDAGEAALFELFDVQDGDGRLFGALRLGAGVGRCVGERFSLAAELRAADGGEALGCVEFEVHVVAQTALEAMRGKLFEFVLSEGHLWGRSEPSATQVQQAVKRKQTKKKKYSATQRARTQGARHARRAP